MMKSKGNKNNKFIQCSACKVFLLSQTAVRKHTKECTVSKGHRKYPTTAVTATISLPFANIHLTRVSLEQAYNANDVVPVFYQTPIRNRGRPPTKTGRCHMKSTVPAVTNDSSYPKSNIVRNGRRRVGGMVKLLQNLGVKSLADVKTISTPRKSSLIAKKKLQTLCKDEGDASSSTPTDLKRVTQDGKQRKRSRGRPTKITCAENDDSYIPSGTKREKTDNKGASKKRKMGQCVDTLYIYKCSDCTAKFLHIKHLNHHIKVHRSGKTTYSCPICAKMFDVRTHYVMHLKRHVDAEAVENTLDLWAKWPTRTGRNFAGWQHQFSCKFCLIRHPTHVSFLTHMKNQHPEKSQDSKFQCQYSCDEIFKSILTFVTHIKQQHGEKYYRTKTIGTNIWRDPNQPTKSVYLSKCDICNKVVTAYHLKSHKLSHEKETINIKKKPFSCPICEVRFKDRNNLRNHFVIHLENNPFLCRFPDCGMKFQDDYYLEKHVKRHFNQLITCGKCDITYKQISKNKHTCIFDDSKIKVGEDGRKYLKQERKSRHKTITDLPTGLEAFGLQSSTAESCNSKIVENVGNIVKMEVDDVNRFEVESVHFVDQIIETEEGAIHIKGEQLSPVRTSETDENNDADVTKIQNQTTTGKRIPILKLITSDPVYQRLIKEKPEVEAIMMGVKRGNRVDTTTFTCSNCGACFFRFCWLELHKKKCLTKNGNVNDITCAKDVPNTPQTQKEVTLMCNTCGYQTLTNEDLQQHMKTATNHGSNYGCRCSYPGCGIRFLTSEGLDTHVQRIHQAEKKFVCEHDECRNKAFASQVGLRSHMKQIHGICSKVKKLKEKDGGKITFRCKKCPAVFDDGTLFATHRRKHNYLKHAKRAYMRVKCQICGDELAGRHSLKRHIALVHTKSITSKKCTRNNNKISNGASDKPENAGLKQAGNGVGSNDAVDNNDTSLVVGL